MTQLWDLKNIQPNNQIVLPGETITAMFWNGVKPVSYTHLTLPTNREV